MNAAIRAELRKARFTRSLWALPAAGVGVAIVGSVLLVTVGKETDIPERLSEFGPLRFGPTNFGLLLLVLGVRLFADETQHRTLSPTFVRTPDRRRVVLAKLVVAAGLVLLFCLVADAVTIAITAVGLSIRDLPMVYDVGPSALMLSRVVAAMVLLALIGLGVGAGLRNRSVAMVAAILWFALGESLAGGLLHITRYLPGSAVSGLVGNTTTPDHFAALVSALLLAAYALVASAAALTALRRDV
ncbi:MAG: type transport system permease protein [Actinomycetota bacterium]|jgi:ABC-type transport system involved in multi-copper enzyme maturation permease subunit